MHDLFREDASLNLTFREIRNSLINSDRGRDAGLLYEAASFQETLRKNCAVLVAVCIQSAALNKSPRHGGPASCSGSPVNKLAEF